MFCLQTEGRIMINLSSSARFKLHQKTRGEHPLIHSSARSSLKMVPLRILCVLLCLNLAWVWVCLLHSFHTSLILKSKCLFNLHWSDVCLLSPILSNSMHAHTHKLPVTTSMLDFHSSSSWISSSVLLNSVLLNLPAFRKAKQVN